MAIGAFIPLAAFVIVAGGVGFRLIALWRRTREVPEMCLGFGLAIVALGMPLAAAGRVPAIALEPLGRAFFSLGVCTQVTGLCLMIFFTYWVFRRGTGWAQALCAALCGALVLAAAWMSTMNFTGASVDEIKTMMRPGTVAMMASLAASFAWSAIEAFSYYGAIRRQLALGMGDAVVANRFLLWGIACTASALLVGVVLVCVLQGMTILREPVPLTAMAGASTIMSATWYLTFFAPESYRRLIRERAAQSS